MLPRSVSGIFASEPDARMTGFTTRVQTRVDYLMQASQIAGGKNMQVIVARRIAVDQWRECILLPRVHAVSPYNAGAIITFNSALDPYTDEDPALIWKNSGAGQSVTWTQGTDSVPQAKQMSLTAPFGPLILSFSPTLVTESIVVFFIAGFLSGLIPARIVAREEILKAIWG